MNQVHKPIKKDLPKPPRTRDDGLRHAAQVLHLGNHALRLLLHRRRQRLDVKGAAQRVRHLRCGVVVQLSGMVGMRGRGMRCIGWAGAGA